MKIKQLASALVASLVLAGIAALPVSANAQTNRHQVTRKEIKKRIVHKVVKRENQQQKVLRQRNERLRTEAQQRQNRLNAAKRAASNAQNRANAWHKKAVQNAHKHTTIVKYTAPRTTVRYVPRTVYRTVPRTTFRYVTGPKPHWYPTTPPNEWSGIASLFGGQSILSLLAGDQTLNFTGNSGALYPVTVYEVDRRSTNRAHRLRAAYFERPFFYRNGHRYERIVVTQGGRRYYRFVRR